MAIPLLSEADELRASSPLFGEAPDPPSDALTLAEAGLLASRVYGFFLEIRAIRAIPPQIPWIAREVDVDEDHVWDLFVWFFRGVDEPWRA